MTLPERAGYLRLRLKAHVYVILIVAAATACGRRLPEPQPIERPQELAQRLQARTVPDQPRHIIFDWRYRGSEGRYSGEGAVRFNPPDSVRLDLLGPGWSGVQSAIMLGEEVYYLGEQRVTLPPPTFMWTMMGSFRPPAGLEPRAVRRGERVELTYDLGGDTEVMFAFDGLDRLLEAALSRRGDVVEEIRLEPRDTAGGGGASTVPRTARYRDLRNFHEVGIDVTDVRERERFDSEIFSAGVR